MASPSIRTIKPQDGFQMKFLSSPADIIIGGAAAGVGKTFALLMEPLRNIHIKGFGGVFFRRTYPQITNEGALWDTSKELYVHVKAKQNDSSLTWTFPNGNRIKFSHLQHEKDIYDYQGSQIPYIAFDELTHFTEKQFFYLLSRNRTTCGVKPYIRATCNPDPESWVARFISWWIGEDGFPIAKRTGVIRYFIKDSNKVVWGDSKQEVIDQCPHIFKLDEFKGIPKEELVKSCTFIPGTIYENKELLDNNPDYLASLLSQDEATKAALLHGNWKIKVDASSMIPHDKINDAMHANYVPAGQRYISADIAMHGSDRFVMGYWNGMRLEDIEIFQKIPANEIEAKIKDWATKYQVPRSHIIYDADGIGAFLRGYLSGAIGFNNGGSPIDYHGRKFNYKNLKTQCFYKLAQLITDSKLYISERVQDKQISNIFIRHLITEEAKCIKRLNPDKDGKLQIIPKEQMKNILGRSPDIMDMMMMRMWFEIKPVMSGNYKIMTTFTR